MYILTNWTKSTWTATTRSGQRGNSLLLRRTSGTYLIRILIRSIEMIMPDIYVLISCVAILIWRSDATRYILGHRTESRHFQLNAQNWIAATDQPPNTDSREWYTIYIQSHDASFRPRHVLQNKVEFILNGAVLWSKPMADRRQHTLHLIYVSCGQLTE